MRSIEVIHKKYGKGDEKYISFARTMLGELQKRMDASGIKIGAVSKILPDGTRIKVRIIHGKEIVQIKTISKEEKEEQCFSVYSGLRVSNKSVACYGDGNGWVDNGTKLTFPERVPYSSSDFTGEMRAIVQFLMGVKGHHKIIVPGVLSADWSNTHGIYIQEYNNRRIPWIVNINAAGVFVKKFPVIYNCKSSNAKEFLDKYGYVPILPSDQFFALDESWRLISSKKVLENFYTFSAFHSRCGWAFDSKGNNAINTGIKYERFPDSHGYKVCYYRIGITGGEKNKPVKASVSKVNEDYVKYVWNGAIASPAKLVMPVQGIIYPFKIALRDTILKVLGDDLAEVPFYVFYGESGGLVEVKWKNAGLTIDDDVNEIGNTDVPMTDGYEEVNGRRKEGFNEGPFYSSVTPPELKIKYGQSVVYRTVPVTSNPVFNTYPDSFGIRGLFSPGSVYWVQENRKTYNGDGTKREHTSCLVPVGNRTGFYLYKVTDEYDNSSITVSYRGGAVLGDPYEYKNLKHRYCPSAPEFCNGESTGDGVVWQKHPEEYISTGTATAHRTFRQFLDISHERGFYYYIANTYYPHSVELTCGDVTNPPYKTFKGFCAKELIKQHFGYLDNPLPIPNGHSNTGTRTEELHLFDDKGSDHLIFSNTEGPLDLDTTYFTEIKLPNEGNRYIPREWNGQAMVFISDVLTGESLYSTAYNGIKYENIKSSYDKCVLSLAPSFYAPSWFGFPGD